MQIKSMTIENLEDLIFLRPRVLMNILNLHCFGAITRCECQAECTVIVQIQRLFVEMS